MRPDKTLQSASRCRTTGVMRRLLMPLALAVVITGCGQASYNEIELMPSPVLYAGSAFRPFPETEPAEVITTSKLFYVTDREKAGPGDDQKNYTNERGQLSRAGYADVKLSPSIRNWQEFEDITFRGVRDRPNLMNVVGVTEVGVLPWSVTALYPDPPSDAQMQAAGSEFARQINTQLALSETNDINIYVHGYNVDFEYSTLVARELKHFLGYQGAFITYNWAATPNRLAYFKDQETATASRRNLRSLIEFLSENTRADRINLLGYSAGSRLAFEVTYQIALRDYGSSPPRLGNVMLISSDLDRSVFGHALADGLLDPVERLSVYLSGSDAALRMSGFVFGRERLGQTWGENDVWPGLERRLAKLSKLEIIDVTEAEESAAGNGHAFFRKSPWASSDIFLASLSSLPAGKRGLVRDPDSAVWHFPPDYPERIARITNR